MRTEIGPLRREGIVVLGKNFEQTELIKAIKIILKLHCSDIKAQKCVCCELLGLRAEKTLKVSLHRPQNMDEIR